MDEIEKYILQNPWISMFVSAGVATSLTLVGFLVRARISKTSSKRATLDREIGEVQKGIERVRASLMPLADMVSDRGQKSANAKEDCIKALMNLRERAKNVSYQLPHTNREFEQYSKVMVELSSLIRGLDGKDDREQLMMGVAKLTMAQGKFERQVRKSPWLAYVTRLLKLRLGRTQSKRCEPPTFR